MIDGALIIALCHIVDAFGALQGLLILFLFYSLVKGGSGVLRITVFKGGQSLGYIVGLTPAARQAHSRQQAQKDKAG